MMKSDHGCVLLVEDNPREQFLIKTIFEELGATDHIYVVNDGQEALDFLKGNGKYANRDKFRFPTFLLTDLKMPRMNGLELLLHMKRSSLIIIPTIVFTNSDDLDDIKQAYLLGANAYHIKAPRLDEQRRQIKLLLDYWMNVNAPAIDKFGRLLPTEASGKLGEKMRHPIALSCSEKGDHQAPKK